MSRIVAITGKGGCGKTTVSALLIRRLIERKLGPVLAVDADPNSCLDVALGVQVPGTLGGIREQAKQISNSLETTGLSKSELLRMKIEECLVEMAHFDFIAMGRPEGPGCYCYANNVLSGALRGVSAAYPSIVIDNEAGLENLSRRIVQNVDWMILVSEWTAAGLRTVRRLHDLANEMKVGFNKLAFVANRVPESVGRTEVETVAKQIGAAFWVSLPYDPAIASKSERGENLFEVSPDNPVLAGVDGLLSALLG